MTWNATRLISYSARDGRFVADCSLYSCPIHSLLPSAGTNISAMATKIASDSLRATFGGGWYVGEVRLALQTRTSWCKSPVANPRLLLPVFCLSLLTLNTFFQLDS